jgi:hypothetical protein
MICSGVTELCPGLLLLGVVAPVEPQLTRQTDFGLWQKWRSMVENPVRLALLIFFTAD